MLSFLFVFTFLMWVETGVPGVKPPEPNVGDNAQHLVHQTASKEEYAIAI